MNTTTIIQSVEFNTTPDFIYQMLMDEDLHADFTGAEATIDPSEGGEFDVWDGYITGRNTELIPNKKIVQEWHASDMPEGHISLLTIELSSVSNYTTLLKMTHANVPADQADDFAKGWEDFYWAPMQKWLSEKYTAL